MIALAGPCDVKRFGEAITRRLGLQFEDAKAGFLGEVLQRRLDVLKLSAEAYLRRLETRGEDLELGLLAQDLTVPETYFFRNNQQFRAFADAVLPERMGAGRNSRVVHILSAACATGDEAYSIAIVAREMMGDGGWSARVRAVDVNPTVLERARRGRYSAWALRETSAERRRLWFQPDGRDVVLSETARGAVEFEQRNIASDDAELWRPGGYDVVFCRNVLMYFSPDQASETVARIARSLAPGGYLFLGHAESLRGLSDDFHLRHSHDAFYYQRKDALGGAPPSLPAPAALTPALGDDWFDTIGAASRRVEALASSRAAPRARPSKPRADLRPAMELLRRERFGEALTSVRDLGPEAGGEALLLEAMLRAHSGEFAEGESACRQLIAADELNAGARYALALCREGVGDAAGAVEQDRIAVHLDPGFAMARLHLGLLARRQGDRAAARRELAQALLLLRREDTSRLLLFGGGFGREALVALCRSALLDCGGQP